MKKYRRLPVAMVAACLTVGLVAAPSAVAASPKDSAKAKSSQSAKSVNRKLNSTNKTLSSTRKSLNTTRKNLTTLGKDLATLKTKLTSAEGGVALLLGAAPQLVTGLQTLGDAVQKQIVPNLTALGTAVQTQIAPNLEKLGKAVQDEIGPGLKKLGDNYTADEYGIVQIAVADNAGPGADDADTFPDALPGCFYESANIPDNVQSAMISGQCSVPAGTTAGEPLLMLTGIRSNENDGTGATVATAAGSAGLVWYEQRGANGDQLGGGATTPVAGFGPTIAIPERSQMINTTEQTFPFGPVSTDALIDVLGSQFAGVPAAPVVGPAGTTISFTMRFLDIGANADDPKA